jgi:uncharacterized protein YodC (DUF2158 family)
MADPEIKPGDVVQLKSGGPQMTVTSVNQDEYGTSAFCVWFDGKKQSAGDFPVHALTKGR